MGFVYSDCHKEIVTSAMTYTASTNKTTFTLPTGMNSSRDLVVIVMVTVIMQVYLQADAQRFYCIVDW